MQKNKKSKHKISVITAAKNSAKTIQKCLNSVNKQTYKEVEHIIIFGESSDNTEQIVRDYIKQHCSQNIKIVNKKVEGIYSAFNCGVQNSSGEFVLFLGSDDWLESRGLEVLYNSLINKHADFAVGYAAIYGEKLKGFKKINNYDCRLLSGGMPFCHQAILASKRCFKLCGAFNESLEISSDYQWIQEAFIKKLKIAVVPQVVVNFSDQGISSIKKQQGITELKKILTSRYNISYDLISCYIDYINGEQPLDETQLCHLIRKATNQKFLKSVALHLLNSLTKLEYNRSLSNFI